MIEALLPRNAPLPDIAAALRQAAVIAGCPEDRVRVSMRIAGSRALAEVRVECREEETTTCDDSRAC